MSLDYKIENIKKDDLGQINKILLKQTDKNHLKQLQRHLRHGIALKLIDEKGSICAFCFAFEHEEHFSLSYYYIYENYRKKYSSLFFFLHCYSKMDFKPIYIYKNKNYDMYKKYFKATSNKNILIFKGLRDDKWVKKLVK